MATQPKSPSEPETEVIELTVVGQKIYDDLRLYYLPNETINFVVDGTNEYVVEFEDRNIFGASLAVLTTGNNLFTILNSGELRARIYSAVELVKTLHTIIGSTHVIIIPPPPPKFPVKMVPKGPQ
jgi:hypothetical protein